MAGLAGGASESLVLVFLAAISATLVGRTDWALPASLLSAFIATGYQWMTLRQQGLPFTARYADEVAAFTQNAPASAQKPSWLGFATAALMTLLAVMKLVQHVR